MAESQHKIFFYELEPMWHGNKVSCDCNKKLFCYNHMKLCFRVPEALRNFFSEECNAMHRCIACSRKKMHSGFY